MRNQFVPQALLLILTVFNALCLVGQDVYPARGQPRGGGRRGSYYNDGKAGDEEYEQSRAITRLYPDPKIYLHNMMLLAHVPGNFGHGELMTIGGNRYLMVGGRVLDMTNPQQPVLVNERAPGGELAYNQALQKWILMRANGCCTGGPAG